MDAPRYEPHVPQLLLFGLAACRHCGSVAALHHGDGRCYTVEEIVARLRVYQRTGCFPGPDEGCEEAHDAG